MGRVDGIVLILEEGERPIKITIPGPLTMTQQLHDDYYNDEAALAMDCAAALNEEIKELFAAGADVVQLDEPWVRTAPDKAARWGINAINRALDGVPGPTIVHLCFGYAAMVKNKPAGYSSPLLATLALPAVLFLTPATRLAGQQREVFNPPGTPTNLPFNNGVKIGNMMWVAGMEGEVNGDIEAEAKSALERIRSVLQAGGMDLKDVVAVQVYLADIKEFQKMNGVYRTFFSDPKPTRTTVQVAGLVNNARIEITVTAVKER